VQTTQLKHVNECNTATVNGFRVRNTTPSLCQTQQQHLCIHNFRAP